MSTATIIKKYQMNYFDPDENSNKVWIGAVFSDGRLETKWGRIRDAANLQSKTKSFGSQMSAEDALEKKRAEKIRKGYRDTEVFADSEVIVSQIKAPSDLTRIASEQIEMTDGDTTTVELIKYLAEVNIHNITSATSIRYNSANATFQTPLGVLTPSAVGTARHLLGQIQQLNARKLFSDRRRADTVRDYFRLVPKDFGVKVPPASELLSIQPDIDNQVSILEALEAALKASDNAPTATEQEKLFRCRLIKVPHWTDEGKRKFREIRSLFEKTKNSNHHPGVSNLKMTALYEVEISNMKTGFDEKAKQLGNVRSDLWHGTKASNLLSILRQGLIIPPASAVQCTGRMFGNGIYTSLQSTKALNYATNFWNRSGSSAQRTFMFLCDAALGKTHQPSSYRGSFPAAGCQSTWVEPNTGGVMNHECVVYDTAQINLTYLAEFGAVKTDL